jgi:hypothetical protein
MYYKTSNQDQNNLGFGGHKCYNIIHFCGLYETGVFSPKRMNENLEVFFAESQKETIMKVCLPILHNYQRWYCDDKSVLYTSRYLACRKRPGISFEIFKGKNNG